MTFFEFMQAVKETRDLVAFTGAGISAESGIPTYRGEDGLWQKFDPAKYANIDYFMANPSYYWDFFEEVRYPLSRRPSRITRILFCPDLKKKVSSGRSSLKTSTGCIRRPAPET